MPNKLRLNTKDESIREILSNGKSYFVPRFQRDYSWEEEQWEILWEDITSLTKEEEEYHYMGYLVLQESADRRFKIIDGQQRLTTFSLLILASVKRLKDLGNEEEREKELIASFIGSKNLETLEVFNKLKLNRNNNEFYKEAVEGKDLPKRGERRTVHLMEKGIEFFYSRLKEYSKGAEIGKFIDTISNKLLFTTIYIGDELNAYKVFETLNARGVQLSSADLLKNYIFSQIDDKGVSPTSVLDDLDERWGRIGRKVGKQGYTGYILAEWNSQHGQHQLVRKETLFKSIKKGISGKKGAVNYLGRLVKNSSLYEGITSDESLFFKDHPGYIEIKRYLDFLHLFKLKQPTSLLLISYIKHRDDFAKILKWIRLFSIRYNVIGNGHSGDLERLYNDICREVNQGCEIKVIKEKLLKLYPKDERFQQDFKEKEMKTFQSEKKARYLLARLEEFEREALFTIDEKGLTLEHILPQKPEKQWAESFGDNWKSYVDRIGNMALATPTDNSKKLMQKEFAKKREILGNNGFKINALVKDHTEWTPEAVELRQKKLSQIAVKLWRID